MRMLVIVYIPDERVFGLASKIRISEKVGVGGNTWGQKPETHFCTDIFETSDIYRPQTKFGARYPPPPPVDRHLSNHYLPATSFADGNNELEINIYAYLRWGSDRWRLSWSSHRLRYLGSITSGSTSCSSTSTSPS